MLEKLMLAAIATVSLNLFLGVSSPTTPLTSDLFSRNTSTVNENAPVIQILLAKASTKPQQRQR